MRKAEVEAVEALLHEPAEDAQQLAKNIIKALDEARAASEQPRYVVVTLNGRVAQAFGPSDGAKAAHNKMSKLPRMDSTSMAVVPLRGFAYAEDLLERIDERE